jgi:hypothetical protein
VSKTDRTYAEAKALVERANLIRSKLGLGPICSHRKSRGLSKDTRALILYARSLLAPSANCITPSSPRRKSNMTTSRHRTSA